MVNNPEGQKDFSYLKLESNYMKYIIQLIICIAIILMIIYINFTTKNSFIVELVILIIACFVLYQIMTYAYNYYSINYK